MISRDIFPFRTRAPSPLDPLSLFTAVSLCNRRHKHQSPEGLKVKKETYPLYWDFPNFYRHADFGVVFLTIAMWTWGVIAAKPGEG
jgi:hypothetical protein